METSSARKTVKIDFFKPIYYPRAFLKFAGLWPTVQWKWSYMVYTILFHITFTLFYDAFKLISFMYLDDFSVITRAMFICLTEFALAIKVVNFYLRFSEVSSLIQKICDFKVYDEIEAKIMEKTLNFITNIEICYLAIAMVSCLFSYIAPFFAEDLILPYPGWYPIDWYNNSLNYWIVYVYQVLGMFFQAQIFIITDVIFIYFMMMIGAQLDVLAKRLAEIGHKNSELELYRKHEVTLVECIKEHQIILT